MSSNDMPEITPPLMPKGVDGTIYTPIDLIKYTAVPSEYLNENKKQYTMKTLCDYELSRLAKEAGFDMDCHDAFMVFGKPNGKIESGKALKSNSELQDNECTRPQLNDLQDWLLENKRVWVQPMHNDNGNWFVVIIRIGQDNIGAGNPIHEDFTTKDQALSEGLKSYFKSKEGV